MAAGPAQSAGPIRLAMALLTRLSSWCGFCSWAPLAGSSEMNRRERTGSPSLFQEFIMGDTSVTKVESKHSPRGEQGQKYLAAGVHVAMRLWEDEQPGEPKPVAVS